MADSSVSHIPTKSTQPKLHNNEKSKPFTQIVLKSLFCVLLLVAITLFPSKAPAFMNQTAFTKLWELAHLLFIGVAVSYGFFSQRKRRYSPEFDENADTHFGFNGVDESESSLVSRIFHVPSVFEDGSDQKCEYQSLDSHSEYCYYKEGEYFVSGEYGNGGSVVDSRVSKGGVFNHGSSGFGSSFEGSENGNVVESWNLRYHYYQGESVNYVVDERERSLGLPLRRLRSSNGNGDGDQFSNAGGLESGSSVMSSSGNNGISMNVEGRSFGSTDHVDLEDRFNRIADFGSHFRYSSMSGMMKIGESSHFRPNSIDQTQFEYLSAQSLRSSASLASKDSSMSSTPTAVSPVHSVSSELESSNLEAVVEGDYRKGYRTSYPPASQPLQTTINGEAPLNAFHLRRYSSGSLFQKKDTKDTWKSSKHDSAENLDGNNYDGDSSLDGVKETGQFQLKQEKESVRILKPSSIGKSVRTRRASRYVEDAINVREAGKNLIDEEYEKARGVKPESTSSESNKSQGFVHISNGNGKKNLGESSKNHIDEEYEKTREEKAESRRSRRNKGEDFDLMSIENGKMNIETQSRAVLPKNQTKEKVEHSRNVNVAPEEDSESDNEHQHVNSSEDAANYTMSDSRHDPNEVDKKASEFIAKFREQIRLQKVASIERSKRKHHHQSKNSKHDT